MNIRIRRTLGNWRWWLVMPLFLIALPLAVVWRLLSLATEAVYCGLDSIASVLRWATKGMR